MDRPNCYKCKHIGTIPGSAHNRCTHPKAESGNPLLEMMAIFASVGRVPPVQGSGGLNVVGNKHGIRNGWFNHPWNFDPAWLESCDGFEAKDATESAD